MKLLALRHERFQNLKTVPKLTSCMHLSSKYPGPSFTSAFPNLSVPGTLLQLCISPVPRLPVQVGLAVRRGKQR
jgi:hypothetical protein